MAVDFFRQPFIFTPLVSDITNSSILRGEMFMKTLKRITLAPQYYELFTCTGSECEDTCCTGWHIHIDKTTYKKYKKLPNSPTKDQISQAIKRNKTNADDQSYAYIVMNEDNYCPMLTREKLCGIQQTLGEGYLSNVCKMYPRFHNKLDETIEKSLSLSCPEAARLILVNPDGIEFNQREEDHKGTEFIMKQLNTKASSYNEYFWDLRVFTIQLLQNRDYSVSDRLIIIGMFYKKIQECIDQNQTQKIPDMIAKFTTLLHESAFQNELQKIPAQVAVQVFLLKQLVDMRIKIGKMHNRFAEYFNQFLDGIAYDEEKNIEEIAEKYTAVHKQYFQPFEDKHGYIFENYLVNYVFKNLFPFGNGHDVFREYILMVVHFGLIKMLMIGMSGYYKESFGVEHAVNLIQSFSRTIEHSQFFLDGILSLLYQNGYASLGYMTVFIRN
jgi:lysine-N-methylase